MREIAHWIAYMFLIIVVGSTVTDMGYDYSTYQKWVIVCSCGLCMTNGVLLGIYNGSKTSKKEGE